jgi:hypothetical protein
MAWTKMVLSRPAARLQWCSASTATSASECHAGLDAAVVASSGRAYGEIADVVADLRWIVLHIIEETARHAGHLDIARELTDSQTGPGPR